MYKAHASGSATTRRARGPSEPPSACSPESSVVPPSRLADPQRVLLSSLEGAAASGTEVFEREPPSQGSDESAWGSDACESVSLDVNTSDESGGAVVEPAVNSSGSELTGTSETLDVSCSVRVVSWLIPASAAGAEVSGVLSSSEHPAAATTNN